MSDKSPKLTVVEKDNEVEIQDVEESTATLLRESGSPSLSDWVPKASTDWSPAPRHQHSSQCGSQNTNLPPWMIQGALHQLPKILPRFLQLLRAE